METASVLSLIKPADTDTIVTGSAEDSHIHTVAAGSASRRLVSAPGGDGWH